MRLSRGVACAQMDIANVKSDLQRDVRALQSHLAEVIGLLEQRKLAPCDGASLLSSC